MTDDKFHTKGEELLAWLMLSGKLTPQQNYHGKPTLTWWNMWWTTPLPAPVIDAKRTGREYYWEDGAFIQKEYYKPKLRYNWCRRPNKAYKEWPELLLLNNWNLWRAAKLGVSNVNSARYSWEQNLEEHITFKTEAGKALYQKLQIPNQDDSFAFYTKVEAEGAFAD